MTAPRGLPGTRCRRRVYLMRHADVAYFDAAGQPLDPRSVPLTAEGREQAAAAARVLAGVPFDLAVCSGLARTVETARVVLAGRGLDLVEEPRLKEVRAARLRDLPADERERRIAYAYETAREAGEGFIGGERWAGFAERVLAAWDDLVARDDWLNLLVVAHDGANRVLLSHVAGAGLPGLAAFEQDPACLNIIELDVEHGRAERAYLRTVNFAPYDPIRDGRHRTVMENIYAQFNAD